MTAVTKTATNTRLTATTVNIVELSSVVWVGVGLGDCVGVGGGVGLGKPSRVMLFVSMFT